MVTAKHKLQRLVFNPAKQKVFDFFDELLKIAKDASKVVARAFIEQFIYAKKPPHLKKSVNHAHLQNDIYEQVVWHLEKELNRLQGPYEMQMDTVASWHKTLPWKSQADMSSLQKAELNLKSMSSLSRKRKTKAKAKK